MLRLPTVAQDAAARERERDREVDGKSQAGVAALLGGGVGGATAEGQAISRRSTDTVAATREGKPDVDDGFHA